MARASDGDEKRLIARCRAGDQEAWRELVEKYQRMVFAIGRRVAGPAAEDAAQETFLRVFRKLDTYRGRAGGKFSSWLYRVAYTVSCDVARRRRGPLGRRTENYDGADPGAGPSELAAKGEEVRLARKALAVIRPECRNALELYYLFGKSYEQVAEITSLPLGTVKSHIHRGKKAMLAALREMGVAESLAGSV